MQVFYRLSQLSHQTLACPVLCELEPLQGQIPVVAICLPRTKSRGNEFGVMSRPTCETLQSQLCVGKDYEPPAGFRPSAVNRLLGRFDSWYYARLGWIVWSGYLRVLMGQCGTAIHNRCSFETIRLVEDCGGRVCVTGVERLARHPGPVVFIANHMSMLETFLLPFLLLACDRVGLITVVKESLLRYPIFGKLLLSTHPISVGRQNARSDLANILDNGVAALQSGKSMLVFPQSTRRLDINSDDFNSIGVKLAKRADVPVVPVALKTDFQGVGGLLRDFGAIRRNRPVRIEFGDPVRISGNGKAEHAQTVQFIVEKVTTWQKQDPV